MPGQLELYIKIAKKVIYNKDRIKHFAKMLSSEEGAVTAAQTVVAAIDKVKPVPPELVAMLAVNSYLLIVDVMQEATGVKPDNNVMKKVVVAIMSAMQGAAQPQPQEQAPAPAPDNVVARMQGGAA